MCLHHYKETRKSERNRRNLPHLSRKCSSPGYNGSHIPPPTNPSQIWKTTSERSLKPEWKAPKPKAILSSQFNPLCLAWPHAHTHTHTHIIPPSFLWVKHVLQSINRVPHSRTLLPYKGQANSPTAPDQRPLHKEQPPTWMNQGRPLWPRNWVWGTPPQVGCPETGNIQNQWAIVAGDGEKPGH